jgi:hypothetical protein
LKSPIGNLAHFLSVVSLPPLVVILEVKIQNVCVMDKVNESISFVAVVAKINRQIEEIVSIFVLLVDFMT